MPQERVGACDHLWVCLFVLSLIFGRFSCFCVCVYLFPHVRLCVSFQFSSCSSSVRPHVCLSLSHVYKLNCVFVCIGARPRSPVRFPLWPLWPDVSAWEQRRTMVTKSQRAVAWGGATPLCRLTGLCFTVISSACLWPSRCYECILDLLSHRRTQKSNLKMCWGNAPRERRIRKWELRFERCRSSRISRVEVWTQLYNMLFWYCITRKGW